MKFGRKYPPQFPPRHPVRSAIKPNQGNSRSKVFERRVTFFLTIVALPLHRFSQILARSRSFSLILAPVSSSSSFVFVVSRAPCGPPPVTIGDQSHPGAGPFSRHVYVLPPRVPSEPV